MSYDGEFVSEIADLAREGQEVETEEIGDHFYTHQTLTAIRPPKLDVPGALDLYSLDGLIGYLGCTDFDASEAFVSVVGPTKAVVSSFLRGERDQRWDYVRIGCVPPKHRFDEPLGQEAFIVWLLTCFEETVDRDRLLTLVSSITDEESVKGSDDGVGQTVTAKRGTLLGSEAAIANPFSLTPLRSFHEIKQVESPFLFRVIKREGQLPALALFEADGGAWRKEATERIVEYLTKEIDTSWLVVG